MGKGDYCVFFALLRDRSHVRFVSGVPGLSGYLRVVPSDKPEERSRIDRLRQHVVEAAHFRKDFVYAPGVMAAHRNE